MGGLVVKQVCILINAWRMGYADSYIRPLSWQVTDPECEDIKRSTVGIIFLGTPHGGTDIADYGAFIAKLKGNDASLVESLKPAEKETSRGDIRVYRSCASTRRFQRP